MQAITTKYLPATNTKGSRIKAQCEAGQVTLSWDNSLNSDKNHEKALTKLLEKLQWDKHDVCWFSGVTHKKDTVWVCTTNQTSKNSL